MEDLLHQFNPWWTREYELDAIPRRQYLERLMSQVETKDVVLVTGLRRVGKTTLLYQVIERLLSSVEAERIFYASLDNVGLKDYSISEVIEEYRRINRLKYDDHVFVFLDEVHLKEDFEQHLKSLYDMGWTKVFASGSASLDILMRSPALTGRQRLMRIHPLSFEEYIDFKGVSLTPADTHLYPGIAEEYVRDGGMPEFVLTRDINYLQSLLDTILFRDIASRIEVRNRNLLSDILVLVAQSVGTPLSIRKIARVLDISRETVNRALDMFVEANLVHVVEKEGRLSERKASPRKIYLADTGLFNVLTGTINLGAIVENAILLSLIRTKSVRYHRRSDREVDFVSEGTAWESKYRSRLSERDMANLSGLTGVKRKVMITRDAEGEMGNITIKPLWRFLLEASGPDK